MTDLVAPKAVEEEKKEIQYRREEAILAAVTDCVRAMRRHGVNDWEDQLKVISMLAKLVSLSSNITL